MRSYCNITIDEMDTFLRHRGFTPVFLPKVREAVYGHIIAPAVCCRVYTGIVGTDSRERGKDAIRIAVVKRLTNGKIIPVASHVSKVYRLSNWRETLRTRIDTVIDTYYATHNITQKAV